MSSSSSLTISAASLPPPPPVPVASSSLEDQEVHRLCELGDLTQVAGSQSLLSQELLQYCSQQESEQQSQSQSMSMSQSEIQPTEDSSTDWSQDVDVDVDHVNETNHNGGGGGGAAAAAAAVLLSSAHAAVVTATAKRYGILTPDDDDNDDNDDNDDDDIENQENAPANSQGPTNARAHSTTRSTGAQKQTQQQQQQQPQHQHHSRNDVNAVSTHKDSADSTTRSVLPLPLPMPLPMPMPMPPLLPIPFPVLPLSPLENRGTHAGGTSLVPPPPPPPYDDDTMDLVMELDEAFTGLDAIKQAAATGNRRGKKRRRMHNKSNGSPGARTPNVFGSLLDAVQLVHRQSQSQSTVSPAGRFSGSPRLQKQQQQREHSMDPHMTTTGNMLFPPAHAGCAPHAHYPPRGVLTPADVATNDAAAANNINKNKNRKSQPPQQQGKQKEASASSNNRTAKHSLLNALTQPAPHAPPPSTTPSNQRQVVAQRAAALAVRVSSDADLAKRLLLSMAMLRDNPRQVPLPSPPAGHLLEDGFFWAHYPPLEQILKDNMARYYALSIGKCQSPEQHTFNNTLVVLVRQTVAAREWSFDRIFMCDKVLRDRIRCYYKTHIQNAKKRLRTMLKNPTKKANAGHLIQHWELIRETIVSKQHIMPTSRVNSTCTATISTSTSSTSDSNSNDSGRNKEGEKKVTKKAAARRVTMEEAAMEKATMEAEDIAWGARQYDLMNSNSATISTTATSASASSNDSNSNNDAAAAATKRSKRRLPRNQKLVA